MRIAEVYVDGFKNIVDTRIRFDDVTCLISPNNYGKSNLFLGIVNGIRFIHSYVLGPDSFFADFDNLPRLKANAAKDYSFEIVLKNDSKAITYGYSYRWFHGSGDPGNISKEYLRVKLGDAKKAKTYIDREDPLNFRFLASSKSSSMESAKVGSMELAFSKLLLSERSFFTDLLKEIDSCTAYIDLVGNLTAKTPVFDLNSPYKEPKGPFDPLDVVLANFIDASPENRNNLVEAMKAMFPNVADIYAVNGVLSTKGNEFHFEKRLPNPGERLVTPANIYLKNYLAPVDLDLMSSGFKRVLALLIHVFQAQKRNNILLMIEEPENAIHPSLLETFTEYLRAINEKSTILLSSHSPFIVNSLDAASVYVGLPHEDGTASFASFKKSKEKAMSSGAYDFGLTTGSYIFELLGGDDYLKSILASYLDK